MDKKILRLLIIDDSPDDAELAAATLRKARYMLKTLRVQDLAATQTALEKSTWDVVLSDVALTHFGASMAIELLKRTHHEIPLIVFTRQIKEADVTKLMQAGALDVVRKDEAFRLAPVIQRELRVADERREWRAMAQKLSELEGKHRAMVDSAREAIGCCQDGMHIDANPTYLELFGYSQGELEGVPVMNLIDKSDQPRFKDHLRKADTQRQEFLGVKKDGTRLHVELSVAPITHNGEACTQLIASDISKRKAAESRLQYLNQHDPLTGLYNRHFFLQALNTALEDARKGRPASGLIYLDLNHIKTVNEEFGHAAGDRMLLKVARVFRDQLGESATLARFGGDEFAVLLNNVNDAQLKSTAHGLANALKENTFAESGKNFNLHCSWGAAVVGKETPSTQKLLADVYHAAQPTRLNANVAVTSVPSPPSITPPAVPMSAVEPKPAVKLAAPRPAVAGEWPTRIQAALEKNAFELVYQPIVNLHGEPAEYFEVLVRMMGADGKSIAPGQFMPIAESSGLATDIDRWVVQRAIEALRELHREDRRATFFINLSPASFREPDLIVQTQKQLWAHNIKPSYLSFEADEQAILAAPAEARTFLQAVKKLGCRFTVDNFGNNMSNLTQLRDLPIDCLKIAGQHIQDLANDEVAQASLKALIQVAKALDKLVIAKSVEKAEDLAVLWNLGVDYVQGHYFQEAASELSYEFGTDTTLSSDVTSPQWASR